MNDMPTQAAQDEVARLFQATEFKSIVRIRGNVQVELDWLCEGLSGDYHPEDPEDVPLLRFDVSRRKLPAPPAKVDDGRLTRPAEREKWEEVDDASYCTRLAVTDPRHTLEWATEFILDVVAEAVENKESIKKTCEVLSWINKDGLKMNVRR